MNIGKFYGIGLGPGDPGLVTLKAAQTLRHVSTIYSAASRQTENSVSGAIIAALGDVVAPVIELTFSMGLNWQERHQQVCDNATRIFTELETGRDCAFVTIGDPLTYSTCGYLLKELRRMRSDLAWEIIPGVNSWSALAATAGEVLAEDQTGLRIVPGYLAPNDAELETLLAGDDTLVLLKTYRSRNQLIAMLREKQRAFIYGANLGLVGQFISDDADAIGRREPEYLSMLLVPARPQEKK